MFSSIKTSKENKEVVTNLTHKFGLGAENVIARIALTYSMQSGHKFKPSDVSDSGGKEYSKKILLVAIITFMKLCFVLFTTSIHQTRTSPDTSIAP